MLGESTPGSPKSGHTSVNAPFDNFFRFPPPLSYSNTNS